ncbi:hypothetical protein R1flu_026386 [Riccia fluitans]|uniref:LAGLIDADG homing endonuclease n=1 Tax=Riccia fluitans TaxID=41844 RepID=A0ABD1XJV4_9MARC
MLTLNKTEWTIPGTLSLKQVQLLAKRYGGEESFNERRILPLMKTLGFSVLLHLQDGKGGKISVAKQRLKGSYLAASKKKRYCVSRGGWEKSE